MGIISILPGQILNGLVYGMVLFLVAAGLTLIFGMMRIVNFAHGAFYMLGAYLSFTILRITGRFWLSIAIAPFLVALIGLFVYWFMLRKVRTQEHELFLTFGIAYIIGELVQIIWGSEPLLISLPKILNGSVLLFGFKYPVYRLFAFFISIIIFMSFALLLYKTRIGIIVRAAVTNYKMVGALGFNVSLIYLSLFGLGSWLAGFAGVIGGALFITNPGMGGNIIIDAFVIITVGGLGSVGGALLAAIIIGELQSVGILFIPQFASILEFLLAALVLIFKPYGLMGGNE